MKTISPAGIDRNALQACYRANRARSAQLFGTIDPMAFEERPIPLRHPPVFYLGHLPAFSFLTLNRRGLGEAAIDEALERLFERGIDPSTAIDAALHERSDWPSLAAVEAFGARCDARVLQALAEGPIEDPATPRLRRAESAFAILEHEVMHHETLCYIIHRLERTQQRRIAQTHRDRTPPQNEWIPIAAGSATLGVDDAGVPVSWDNERNRHIVGVTSFAVQRYPVTNADWLAFVGDGGAVPPFWVECDGEWHLLGMFETLPLPQSWPVWVSQEQAAAYAAWKGLRLPTEAEYHRATFGAPDDEERAYPWGFAPPGASHGNFDFRRFDPEPVDAHPAGASAWGVCDTVGNGWEWTSTPFAPFPGFAPLPSYPQYSADFFDGRHFVAKGASPVTGAALVRRSFRNWFYADYPYAYAKFRCVRDR